MATERLYLNDASLLTFRARALRASSVAKRPSLILDRSAFFPEGGGQPGDRGALVIGGVTRAVLDTQVDDDGWVHHLIEGDAVDEGAEVEGLVDGARRRDLTAQHTAQHMLSAALLKVAGAETVSARLGEASSTIDVAAASLDDRPLHGSEDLTNEAVMGDLAIRVLFPTPDELKALPLRRDPKVQQGIRVIDIEGFDCSPCGGTHCARSGQVGPVRVSAVERYKGLWRVHFLAGRRALADHRAKDETLRELARGFSCGPFDVGAAVERLRAEVRERSDQLGNARGELVRLVAEAALAACPPGPGPTRVVLAREGDDIGATRALAGALARRPDVVALVASRQREGDWVIVVERGAAASFDCGAWLKATAQRLGGRGGGRPEHAEGKLPGSVDWASAALQ